MSGVGFGKAAAFAVPVILLILGGFYAGAYFVTTSLGLPASLGFPWVLSAVGWAVAVIGVAVGGWVFRYRSPAAMMGSTYVTFAKMFRKSSVVERAGRAEPLVVEGPQKYTRNPLYLAVLLVAFGWSLATASTCVLVWSAALLVWFSLILIPFEERELLALFGAQYANYARAVPMLVPFTKRRRS